MSMSPTWQELMTIAGDERISDKNFRWIFSQVTRMSFFGRLMVDRLKILREQAIIETERDRNAN